MIIDEAHERKVNIDFLLYLLRKVVQKRPEFKLIIMSATINEKIFRDYFKNEKYDDLMIGGKTNYPIESIFLKSQLDEKNKYFEKGHPPGCSVTVLIPRSGSRQP